MTEKCEEQKLTEMFELHDAIYTCIGKGGRYRVIGVSTGAGKSRGEVRITYRCQDSGRLFHRELEDFYARFETIPT